MSKINYWKTMTRRKPLPQQECEESKLGRVFGTFDLTALGVSATLGVGVYVLAGHVAKDQAGPSVILSFLIAALASLLAGLCYAEFSSRVPKSGSAYIFTYVAIGEFLAFIVGWNLILEYVIGAASISRGLSLYIDSLIHDSMKNYFREITPISWDFLSGYFDFFAFACPLLIGSALAFGLRKSAGINNILCVLNLGVVAFVVIAVLLNADINNWKIDPTNIPAEYASKAGTGGFFPFGFSGTLKGAATCFFGFVGFDCIATTGEEVRNPQKTVPRALLFSLLVIFIAYFGVSLLTLMWPYYLLDPEAPLPHAFQEIGWITPMWIVTIGTMIGSDKYYITIHSLIGGIVGLMASLFGALFPLPRILYAMAQDGLIFRGFGTISPRFKTPVIGTLSAALLTSFFAALFDLAALVSMLSIGVLLAYTVVAISIIILRFSQAMETGTPERHIETSNLLRPGYNVTAKGYVLQLIRMNASRQPNTISMWVVGSMIMCYCVVCFALGLIIIYAWDEIAAGETWAVVLTSLFAGLLVVFCLFISIQPRQKFPSTSKPFKVPLVPILPAVSVFINIYLMLMLDFYTWIRFGIWMILGLPMYLACARIYNSNNNNTSMQVSDDTDNRTSNQSSNGNLSVETTKDLEAIREKHGNDPVEFVKDTELELVTVHKNALEREGPPERRASEAEIFVETDESETNSALKMLDTVLEGEAETDSVNSNGSNTAYSYTSKTSQSSLETNVTIIEELRVEILVEIDEILNRAQAAVEDIRMKSYEKSDSDEHESVFKDTNFLNRLNYLISQSNPRSEKRPKSNNQPKAVERSKSLHGNQHPQPLSKSKSEPNFQQLLESTLSLVNNSVKEENSETNASSDKRSIEPRVPPIFGEELLKKVSTLKNVENNKKDEKEKIENKEEDDEKKDKNEEASEKKEDFREKLEKLLQLKSTEMTSNAPIPKPRKNLMIASTSDITTNDEPQYMNVKEERTEKPPDPLRMMQRKLFDEVLKKIQKKEDEKAEDASIE